ncbi:MAG TPA: GNAT family N-acetyltransferase [Pyrinomonadaceae bacterium]|nr:GNAT family N-acetyltransferase [Pyrinomonadaceae bacterium]
MDKMNLQIRKADSADAEILAQISWKSFYDAFADHPKNDPSDLKSYMDEAFTVEAISAELADKDSFFFVAETENQMVGYAKLKQNSREDGVSGENPIELCRLYSLNEFIGKGIGKALMLKCLEFAKENGNDIIWLGVWEYNYNAQKFYTKFGFEKCGEHIFQLGSDPQTDWLMQKKI